MSLCHELYRARFAYPGWVPPGWTFCRRCGEPWPRQSRFWKERTGRYFRLCRACYEDGLLGIWPLGERFGRHHRWDPDGSLRRRCSTCHQWRPIEAFPPRYERSQINLQGECGECTRVRMRRKSRALRRAA